MHPVIKRLFDKMSLTRDTLPSLAQWQKVLDKLDHTYTDRDRDRLLLEHALELSSEEMESRLNKINKLLEDIKISNAHYKAMLESSPIGIFTSDESGKITYANSALTKFLGVDAEQFLQKGLLPFVSEKDRERLEKYWLRITTMPTASTQSEEYQFKLSQANSTTKCWGNLFASPIAIDRTIIGNICMLENTSDKKRREDLLHTQIGILRLISFNGDFAKICAAIINLVAQQLPHISCSFYLRGHNEFTLVGSSVNPEKLNLTFPVRIPKVASASEFEQCNVLPHEKGIVTRLFPLYAQQEEIYGLLIFAADRPLGSSEIEQQILGLCFNLMDLALTKKTSEDALEVGRQQLLAASKLASLGEMAGGIAHEINNPLAIIDGYAYMLEVLVSKQTATPELLLENIKKIRVTVGRVNKIVAGLRNFSRNSATEEVVEANLGTIVQETVELCSEKFRHANISIEIPPHLNRLNLFCNPVQVSQVFLNLLTNAYDAIEGMPEKWIKIEATSRDNSVIVSVIDSGSGIPQAITDKIMEAYFTTKKRGKGTGLGLSICAKIVSDHHGKIYVDSQRSNTCFTLELPLKGASRASTQ